MLRFFVSVRVVMDRYGTAKAWNRETINCCKGIEAIPHTGSNGGWCFSLSFLAQEQDREEVNWIDRLPLLLVGLHLRLIEQEHENSRRAVVDWTKVLSGPIFKHWPASCFWGAHKQPMNLMRSQRSQTLRSIEDLYHWVNLASWVLAMLKTVVDTFRWAALVGLFL